MYLQRLSDLTKSRTVTRLVCERTREWGHSELFDAKNAIRDHGDLLMSEFELLHAKCSKCGARARVTTRWI
jgi:hypothetical protein